MSVLLDNLEALLAPASVAFLGIADGRSESEPEIWREVARAAKVEAQ